MKKRVIFIHRWDGTPDADFLPWLKKEFETKGYEVIIPKMPETRHPKIAQWVDKLKEIVVDVREDDILIGHSIGCQTIFRFLESLPSNKKINKAILLAPWIKLVNLSDEKEWEIAKPWLETAIDFEKIKQKAKEFVCIYSDNDKWVPLDENKNFFEEKLNSQVIVEHAKGHFTQDDGVLELPVLLNLLG